MMEYINIILFKVLEVAFKFSRIIAQFDTINCLFAAFTVSFYCNICVIGYASVWWKI